MIRTDCIGVIVVDVHLFAALVVGVDGQSCPRPNMASTDGLGAVRVRVQSAR